VIQEEHFEEDFTEHEPECEPPTTRKFMLSGIKVLRFRIWRCYFDLIDCNHYFDVF